jgi:hypothetical protein
VAGVAVPRRVCRGPRSGPKTHHDPPWCVFARHSRARHTLRLAEDGIDDPAPAGVWLRAAAMVLSLNANGASRPARPA